MNSKCAKSISVVIPCYNHGGFIDEAIASVLNLSRDDTEIIVVDDGSTDRATLVALEQWASRGITVLKQRNAGLGAARNAGIQIARGQYIVPLDSDNKVRSIYFEEGMKLLDEHKDVSIVYGDAAFFGDRSGEWAMPDFDLLSLVQMNFIDACALYRKVVWQDVGGYDERMPWMGWEDWDFWLRAAFRQWQFHHLPKIAFDYRVRSGSMISETNRHQEELLKYVFDKPENKIPKALRVASLEYTRLRRLEQSYSYRLGRRLLSPLRFAIASLAWRTRASKVFR